MMQVESRSDDPGTAGVVARPPLIFLAALVLAFGVDHLLPLPRMVPSVGLAHLISAGFGGLMVVAGVAFVAIGIGNFNRAATPVPTNQATRALVTTGIHAFTRNPIYLGMGLAYVGIALLVRSPWLLILALPLAIVIRYGVVAREEAYLERRFGDAYRTYRSRVRRWL